MASTNQSPFYQRAQAEYEAAQTTNQKIICLKKMIVLAPKHKSSENMLANLKTRLKKLKYSKEKESKAGKSKFKGIKKEDMQAILIGKTNSGKSSLISILTNIFPKISSESHVSFTTKTPVVGMANIQGTQVQLIENPAIESKYYDRGLPHAADILLIIINRLEDIKEILEELENHPAKKIIIFNKIDLLNEKEKRKISSTLASKKYDFILISTKTSQGIEELKEKIIQSFDKIRVYTKEPKKEKSPRPIILNPNATVKDVAEKILHGFSKNVKETKIWGPSSKFPGQKVGLQHKLKNLDIVEFKTK